MNFVSAILLIAATTNSTEPMDYSTAYKKAMKGDKPLLVLVTAEWCPPCQVMKNSVLPELLEKKTFAGYHFATVDFDAEKDLAKQLVRERGIPQLLLYEKNESGNWGLRYLSGAKSVDVVESFLTRSSRTRTAKAKTLSKTGH